MKPVALDSSYQPNHIDCLLPDLNLTKQGVSNFLKIRQPANITMCYSKCADWDAVFNRSRILLEIRVHL